MNVFEKIIEKLEKYPAYSFGVSLANAKDYIKVNDLMSILQEVAEEHNNGWIPCSERLPEEHDSMFAKWKGTDKWRKGMFAKASDDVIVTVLYKDGEVRTTYAHTIDGKWSCDLLKIYNTYKIIAWQPLPEPYEEREKCEVKK